MGIDAGGTMTDTFFVRDDGRFVVGKAQSNPADESLAIFNSSQDALAHWGRDVDEVYPELATCVYSGTAMLNRILDNAEFKAQLLQLGALPVTMSPLEWSGAVRLDLSRWERVVRLAGMATA